MDETEFEYLTETSDEWYWDQAEMDNGEIINLLFVQFGHYWYWYNDDLDLVSITTIGVMAVGTTEDLVWEMWYEGLITNDIEINQWVRIVDYLVVRFNY